MSLKLEVGKRYVRRDGEITDNLTYLPDCDSYPFLDSLHIKSYTSEGSWWTAEDQKDEDLVAEYVEDTRSKAIAPRVSFATYFKYGYPAAKGHDQAVEDVECELLLAQTKFPAFHTAHEGYAVLKEEVDELWEAIRKKQGAKDRPAAIREEAVQVAAMAIRLILDCCEKDSPSYGK